MSVCLRFNLQLVNFVNTLPLTKRAVKRCGNGVVTSIDGHSRYFTFILLNCLIFFLEK